MSSTWLRVVSVALLVAAVSCQPGRGRRRPPFGGSLTLGDACDASTACTDAFRDLCVSNPTGNKCLPSRLLGRGRFLCETDDDCVDDRRFPASLCFVNNGADAGYCNGCELDADCDTGDTCLKPSSDSLGEFPNGICGVSCSQSSDCASDEFCTADASRPGRFGASRPDMCRPLKANGERCFSDVMCSSGNCANNRRCAA